MHSDSLLDFPRILIHIGSREYRAVHQKHLVQCSTGPLLPSVWLFPTPCGSGKPAKLNAAEDAHCAERPWRLFPAGIVLAGQIPAIVPQQHIRSAHPQYRAVLAVAAEPANGLAVLGTTLLPVHPLDGMRGEICLDCLGDSCIERRLAEAS